MPAVALDNSVQTQVNKSADLTAKKAGDLAMATVHLFVNNINPTPQNILADFTIPTYTGYPGGIAIAGWTANSIDLQGAVSTDATTVASYVGPNDGSGQTIYGFFVRSAGIGTPLIYAARFSNPFPLATPADVLNLVATFKIP